MEFKHEDQLISNGTTREFQKKRADMLSLIKTGIDAVNPYLVVSNQFQDSSIFVEDETMSLSDFTHIFVIAFGKASLKMTQAVIDHCPVTKGIVITNDKTKRITHPTIETYHGGHPIPNQGSINGTKAIEHLISEVSDRDLLLILISGGGSALLCHPRISLEDMQQTTSLLLKSGATIQEINTIRKHLSFVKGGQLIRNSSGRIVSFVISDVIGDPLGFIASGPTVGDQTTYQQSKSIFEQYNLWETIPESSRLVIDQGIQHKISETPFEDEIDNLNGKTMIVASNTLACSAIFDHAKTLGYNPYLHSTTLQGEAKEVGPSLVTTCIQKNRSDEINLCIAGGETTVTVKGTGKGGRNQEMVLASLPQITHHSVVFASYGTDGIDGMSDAAGAIADPCSLKRAEDHHLDMNEYLNDNNSYAFFNTLSDLLICGPTGTNVMDIQILIT